MPTELRWLISTSASCLHAAGAIARGQRLVDRATALALSDEVGGLLADVAARGLDPERFFEHAVPQSICCDAPLDLAKAICAKLVGSAVDADPPDQLARRLAALQRAFDQANPNALAELELRAEPLRGQWEARGPGLLAEVARRTEPELVVSRADVVLVQPVLGGGGAAHWLYNSVRVEAVLANPIAELPEVVRLGWLLAQLNLDLPRLQGNLHRNRLLGLGPLAMIPPVLQAAQEVELARYDRPTLAAAVTAWTDADANAVSGTLAQWWETYAATNPEWTVALGALDQMLAGESFAGNVDVRTTAYHRARAGEIDDADAS